MKFTIHGWVSNAMTAPNPMPMSKLGTYIVKTNKVCPFLSQIRPFAAKQLIMCHEIFLGLHNWHENRRHIQGACLSSCVDSLVDTVLATS